MTITETTWAALRPVIASVARKYASEYPGVEREDISQELHLFALENAKSFVDKENANFRFIFERAARRYCGKSRAQGLTISAQYGYRPEDVRRILETYVAPEQWPNTHVPDDARSLKPHADPLDMCADVALSLAGLDEDDRQILHSRYVLGEVPDNSSAARKRLNKAVDRLTAAMNSFKGEWHAERATRGFPGSRSAVSNATAQRQSTHDYDPN
ncbi:hypothetical protein Lfu02_17460 [Longispora fulva]|uniref:DNA-directed RNA polymerase specialized sigma24 family protein n=1 Tax=Longispora fulva TaxID=619741 RepID=A0A8J7GL74_9ACTN|nr:hypothetical protein [Longispora fulva]MBG6140246.1 DNA-directed RNA polymerase specialized sigma24 family protein [Longispora fulva]GIG57374.1 hypothetical protein Lfu02_17460 [Longispora fulva]